MLLEIVDVECGAEFEEIVYDFWVTARLKSGRQIRIFDFHPFDLRDKLNQKVDCLVLAGFIKNVSTTHHSDNEYINGIIKKEFHIPNDWMNVREDIAKGQWLVVETEDGAFLVNPQEIEDINFNQCSPISFLVGRFDLVGHR